MKYTLLFLIIVSLAGCGTVEPPKQELQTIPVDLFGMSYYDSRYHFIKVELPSKKITVLTESDSIQTGTTNAAALNSDANEYYFFSNHRIFVVNTATGEFTKSFKLAYDADLLVYNPFSKKLNALSHIDVYYHFIEIDVQVEKIRVGPALKDVVNVNEGSASMNSTSATYYFSTPANYVTINAIDANSGTIIKSYDTLRSVTAKGVVSVSDTTLFGMTSLLTGNRLFIYNTALRKIRMLAPTDGKMIDYSNKTIANGMYFYARDANTLNGVDIETGVTILSITFQNTVYNLIPVRRK